MQIAHSLPQAVVVSSPIDVRLSTLVGPRMRDGEPMNVGKPIVDRNDEREVEIALKHEELTAAPQVFTDPEPVPHPATLLRVSRARPKVKGGAHRSFVCLSARIRP